MVLSNEASAEIEWRQVVANDGSTCVQTELTSEGTLGSASCSGLPLERALFSCLVMADGGEVPAPRVLVAQQDNALISSGGTAGSGSGPGPPLPSAGLPTPPSFGAGGGGGVLEQMAGYLAAALPGRGAAVEQMSIDSFEEQLFRREGWAANSSDVAGLPVSPLSTYLLADQLAPLGALLPRDARLQWSDFNAFFRTVAAVYDGEVISVPYTAEIPLLFYRTDVFAERGLRPPATWHEYLHLAGQLHGASMRVSPHANSTIAGWCESFPTGCSYDGITLASIWTNFVARQGPQAGVFFDPQTMSPRLAGAGMAESIRVFRAMHAFVLEPHPPDCLRNSLAYILQNCALFPAVSTLWKHVMATGGDFLRGRLGVARLPGSELVEHPDTGELVPCTQALCPFGELTDMQSPAPAVTRYDLSLSQQGPGTSSPLRGPVPPAHNSTGSSGPSGRSRSLLGSGSDRRQAWVNYAPFLGRGAMSLGVSARANPAWQYAAWRAISAALAPEAMWASLLDPNTAFSPVRDSHMDEGNIGRWVAAGYDRGAALGYLSAFRGVVLHPNAVMSPRIPGTERLGRILADLSSVLQYNASVSEVALVQQLRADLRLAFNASDPVLRQRYRADIGYTTAPVIVSAAQAVSSGLTAGAIAGVVVSTVAGTALLGVLCLLLGRGYNKYRSHLVIRMSSAPTYGHDTSLMITDIMDSTKLWEQVDEAVMDVSLDMHNRTIRHLLPKYGAYECHTEGDSFILAYHTAADAVACALEIQVALLHLDWPEELLLADACRAVLALPPPSAAAGPSPPVTSRGGLFGGGGGRILAGAAAAMERMGVSTSRMSLDTALARGPGYSFGTHGGIMGTPSGIGMGLGPELSMGAHTARQLSGGPGSPYHISGSGAMSFMLAGRPSGAGGGTVGVNSRQPSSNLFALGSQGLSGVPNRSGDGRKGFPGNGAPGFVRAQTEEGDGPGSPQVGSSNVSSATPRRMGRRRTHGDSDTAQTRSNSNLDRNVFAQSDNGSGLVMLPISPRAAASPGLPPQLQSAQLQQQQSGQVYHPNQPYLPQTHIQRGGPSIPSPIPEGRPSRRDLQLPASAVGAAAAEFYGGQGAAGAMGGGSGTPSRRTSSYGRSSSHTMWPGGGNTANTGLSNWSTASAASGLALTGGAGVTLAPAPTPAAASGAGSGRWQAGSFSGPAVGLTSPALPLSRGASTAAASQYSRTTASASGAAGPGESSPRSGPGGGAAAAAAAAATALVEGAGVVAAARGGGGHNDNSQYLGGFPSERTGRDQGPARSSHSWQPGPSAQQLPSPGLPAPLSVTEATAERPLPPSHSGPLPLHYLESHLHPPPASQHHIRLPPSLRRTADGNALSGARRMGSPDVVGTNQLIISNGFDSSIRRLSGAGMGAGAGASGPLLSTGGTGLASGASDNNSSGALQRLGHSGSGPALYAQSLRSSTGPPPGLLGPVAELASMAEGEEDEEVEAEAEEGDGEGTSGQAEDQEAPSRRRSTSGQGGRMCRVDGSEPGESVSAPLQLVTKGSRKADPGLMPAALHTHCEGGLRSYRAALKPGTAASSAVASDGAAGGLHNDEAAGDGAAAAASAGYSSPFALNGWLRAVFAQEMAAAAGTTTSTGATATGFDSAAGPGSTGAGPSNGFGSVNAGRSPGPGSASIGPGSGGASMGNTAGPSTGSFHVSTTAGMAPASAAANSAVSWAGASLSLRHMPALRLSNSQRYALHQPQHPSEMALMHAIIGAGTAGSAMDSDARLTVMEDLDSGGPDALRTGSGSHRLRTGATTAGNGSPGMAAGEGGHAPAAGPALSGLGRPPRAPQRGAQPNADAGAGADTAANADGSRNGGCGGGAQAEGLGKLVLLEEDEEQDDIIDGNSAPAPGPPSARAALLPLPAMPTDTRGSSRPSPSPLTLRPNSIKFGSRQPQRLEDAAAPRAGAGADAASSSPRDCDRSSQLPGPGPLQSQCAAIPVSTGSEQAHPSSFRSQSPRADLQAFATSTPPQPPPAQARWPPWRAFTMSGVPASTPTSSAAALLALRPASSRTAAKPTNNDSSALPSGLLRAPSLFAKRLFGLSGGSAVSATAAAPPSAGTGAGSPVSLPRSPTGDANGSSGTGCGPPMARTAVPQGAALALEGISAGADQAVDSSGSAAVLGGSGYPAPGTPRSIAGGNGTTPSGALSPFAAPGAGAGKGGGERLTERITSLMSSRSPFLFSGGSKLRSRRQRPSVGGGGGLHPEGEPDMAAVLLCRRPADRRTFRHALLQLCYCQHATASAVGGGAGRAAVRRGSVTALLSPLAGLMGGTSPVAAVTATGTPPGSGARRAMLSMRDSVLTPELLAAAGSAAPSPSSHHPMALLSPKGYSSNATGASSSRGGAANSSAEDSDRVTGTATGTSGDELSYPAVSGRGSAASAGAVQATMGAAGGSARLADAQGVGGAAGSLGLPAPGMAQARPGPPAARVASAGTFGGRAGSSSSAVASRALMPSGAAAAAAAAGQGLDLGPLAATAAIDVESSWVEAHSASVLHSRGAATASRMLEGTSAEHAAVSGAQLPRLRGSSAGEGSASSECPAGAPAGAPDIEHSPALHATPSGGALAGARSRRGSRSVVKVNSDGGISHVRSSSSFMQVVGRFKSLVAGGGAGPKGGSGAGAHDGSRRSSLLSQGDSAVEGRSPSLSRRKRDDGPSPLPPGKGSDASRSRLQLLELPAPDSDAFEPRSSDPSPRAATPAAAIAVAAAAAAKASAAAVAAAKSFRRGKQPDMVTAAESAAANGANATGGGNADAPWLVPSGLDDPTGLLVRRAVSHTAAVNHMRGSRRVAALQRRLPYLEAAARAHTLGRPYQVGPSAAALAVAARGALQPEPALEEPGLPPTSAAIPTPGGAATAASPLPAHGSREAADGAAPCELGLDGAGGSGGASGRGSGRPTGSSSATAGAAAASASACGPGCSDDGCGTSTATTTVHMAPAVSGPSLPGGAGPASPGAKRAVGLGPALLAAAGAAGAAADQASGSAAPPSASAKSQKLQPPPKLADAVLVRRRHSMASLATLWPGAFQNPLAAYGPAGPSRFLAAEVLHELSTAADTAPGLGAAPAAGGLQVELVDGGDRAQEVDAEAGPAGSEPGGWKALSGALRGVLKLGGGGGGGGGTGNSGNRRGSVARGPSFEVLRASGKLPGITTPTDTPLPLAVDGASSGVQRSAMSMTQLRDALRQGSFTAAAGASAAAMVATGGATSRSAVFGSQVQAALLAQMQVQQQAAASQAAAQQALGSPLVWGRTAMAGQGRYPGVPPTASTLASRTAPNNIVAAGGPLLQTSQPVPPSPRDTSMSLPKSRTASGMGGGVAQPAAWQPGSSFPARMAATAHGFQGHAGAAAAVVAGAPHLQHSNSNRSHQSHISVASGGGTVLQRLLPTRRLSGTGVQTPRGSHGPAPLCFRGFRVRIGVSSGLTVGRDVIWVKASGRVAYSGYCMSLTKLVADAGMGGMVLLSGDAWERLQPWPEPLANAKALHCGRYELTDVKDTAGGSFLLSAMASEYGGGAYWARGRSGGGLGAAASGGGLREVVTDVFSVTNSALLPRLAHWEQDGCACGLRHGRRLVPGIMDAPLGRVTFVCVGVVGLPVLRAWDAACAAESLGLWEATVLDVAAAWEGHPAAMSDGVALVAFHEPVFALAFAVALQASLREEVAWPEALLEHSLGEALELPAVRFRGLRTRATAETAEQVRFDVRAATSGALYLNQAPKVMKRLRAMAARARMGQLLCRGGVAVELLRAAGRAAAALSVPGDVQRLDSGTTTVTTSHAGGGGPGGMLVPANRTMSMLSQTGSQGGRATPRGSFGGVLSLTGGGSQRAFFSGRSSRRGGAGGAGGTASGAPTGLPARTPSLANARASSATLGPRSRSSTDGDDVLAELPAALLGPAPAVAPVVPPSALLPAATDGLPASAPADHAPFAGDPSTGAAAAAAVAPARSNVVPTEESRLTNSSAAADSGAAAAVSAGMSTEGTGTGTVCATFAHNVMAASSPARAAFVSPAASPLLSQLHVRLPSPPLHPDHQDAPYGVGSPVGEIARAEDSAGGATVAAAAADLSLSMALLRCSNRAASLQQLLLRLSMLPLLDEAPPAKPKRVHAAQESAASQHPPSPRHAATGEEARDLAHGKKPLSRVGTGTGTGEAADGASSAIGAKVLEALAVHGDDSVVRLPRVGEEVGGGPHVDEDGASDSGGGPDEGSRSRGPGGGRGRRPTADAMAAAAAAAAAGGERRGAMRLGLPVLSAEAVKPNGVYLVVLRTG
ncbi:hypothetical protein HYH02_007879 [Chlamydomonas schloesseri]|uniref:Guanylate cyclase domain-containing protein n=1 Tax=Chlamydomonas schloesseri TaxID=2026947 RepID=A0A835WGL1_9CHLO|nr:hypothetical protein HYH02_007879 [Chlamydomonas schloesseri]|eukprot:KAG2447133.1 hypothetical protein HYH02_007879 [Chlamydomonas schloesseri]